MWALETEGLSLWEPGEPGGRAPLPGTLKDIKTKAVETGPSLHRGARCFTGDFERGVRFYFIRGYCVFGIPKDM